MGSLHQETGAEGQQQQDQDTALQGGQILSDGSPQCCPAQSRYGEHFLDGDRAAGQSNQH